jgi:hypothetical protein
MTKLPKFTLDKNERTDKWDLRKDSTDQLVKSFTKKEQATKGGVLERAVGSDGGSVRIHKEHGGIQEERTYPRSRDPKKSPG